KSWPRDWSSDVCSSDLLPHADDAIRSQAGRVGRKVREGFPCAAGQPGFVSHHRHVADGALVLDEPGSGGVIDGFPPYARHPIRIAAGIGHHAGSPVDTDRDVLSGGSGDSVVAGEALIRRLK